MLSIHVFIHSSFIHSSIRLHTGHSSRLWVCRDEQHRPSPCPCGIYILMGKDKQEAIKSIHKMMWRSERVETWALPLDEAVDAAVQKIGMQRCSRPWEIRSTALPLISLFSRFRKYP